jgi:hypothetical protein
MSRQTSRMEKRCATDFPASGEAGVFTTFFRSMEMPTKRRPVSEAQLSPGREERIPIGWREGHETQQVV